MARLSNTVAVVTGGGRGIGREIALEQAREGAKVAVLARTVTEIEETVSLIEERAGKRSLFRRTSSTLPLLKMPLPGWRPNWVLLTF